MMQQRSDGQSSRLKANKKIKKEVSKYSLFYGGGGDLNLIK